MRKMYKVKRHSCILCKAHKMGWLPRFTDKDILLLKLHDREMRAASQRFA